jgi:hypothetical protein
VAEVQKIKIAELPEGQQRVETGAVEFTYPLTERQKAARLNEKAGTDWLGYFLRGDSAFALSIEMHSLQEMLKKVEHLIPPEDFAQINWHLHNIVDLKDDIVSNTIVGGKERFPDL